jgi:hypothetical protein
VWEEEEEKEEEWEVRTEEEETLPQKTKDEGVGRGGARGFKNPKPNFKLLKSKCVGVVVKLTIIFLQTNFPISKDRLVSVISALNVSTLNWD